MAEYFGEKRHPATPRRRQQAREEGHVARSQDLASAALLMAGLASLTWMGGRVVIWWTDLATSRFSGAAWSSPEHGPAPSAEFAAELLRGDIVQAARVVLPLMGLLVSVAAAAHLAQTGFLLAPRKLAPNPDHVNPFKGLGRVLSWNNGMRCGLGILKIAAVALVAGTVLWNERQQILSLPASSVPGIAAYVGDVVLGVCLKTGAALGLLAIVDYAYQRWKHERELRMTDQELREELRSLQGDPQLNARRRLLRRDLALNRGDDRSAAPRDAGSDAGR